MQNIQVGDDVEIMREGQVQDRSVVSHIGTFTIELENGQCFSSKTQIEFKTAGAEKPLYLNRCKDQKIKVEEDRISLYSGPNNNLRGTNANTRQDGDSSEFDE